VVADAFSRLCEHHPLDEVAIPERLTALLMSGGVSGTKEPTIEPRPTGDNSRPVTTEPAIEPNLRAKIEAAHNSVSGHFGIEYTRKVLLGRRVNDERLRQVITKFVCECPVCQLRSVLNRQIKTHRFTTASYTPMEVLNIDTIGPVSKDSADNCYILVIIDCFTRFVELYPRSDTSALPCARALLSYVCKKGTPMTIRLDRGTQFVNGIINQLLGLLQIEHELSLAYSKEQNVIVERANKAVMRHLTVIISTSDSVTCGLLNTYPWSNAS
jgi:transposase InsO family protein